MSEKFNITMVAWHSCIRVIKEAIALKKHGYNVSLITQRMPQIIECFDSIGIYTDKVQFNRAVIGAKCDIFHVHNEPDWIVSATKKVAGGRPVIFDVHDLDSMYGKTFEPLQEEIEAFDDADGFIHVSEPCRKGAEDRYGNDKPAETIYSYVNEMFIASDSEIIKHPCFDSLVYEGGLSFAPPKPVPDESGTVFYDLRYLPDVVKAFRREKYLVTVLPANRVENKLYMLCGATVHNTTDYLTMLFGLRVHGLGFVGATLPNVILMNAAMPNKLFEYISQGVVPVVHGANEIAKFVKKYNCGIVLDSLKNIRNQITNVGQKRKNVLRLRKELTMESQVDKIVNLYKSVLDNN